MRNRRWTQTDADACLPRTHPRPSAVCESCFPGKKSRKTFGRILMLIKKMQTFLQNRDRMSAGNFCAMFSKFRRNQPCFACAFVCHSGQNWKKALFFNSDPESIWKFLEIEFILFFLFHKINGAKRVFQDGNMILFVNFEEYWQLSCLYK